MKRVPVPLLLIFICAWVFFGCSLGLQAQTATPTLGSSSASVETSTPADDLYSEPAATEAGVSAAESPQATPPQAAQATDAQPTSAPPPAGATQSPTSTATAAGGAGAAPVQNLVDTIDPTLISNLVDGEVAGADGAEIAEIDSLVLDRAAGQIAYVFLKTEVDLDDADQVVGVPWAAFQVTDDVNDTLDRITFTLDPALLAGAPALVVNDAFNYSDPAWDDQLAGYWSSQAASLLPNTGAGSTAAGMLRLEDEDDLRLLDAQGGPVAEVEEVVIDPAAGQFRYVLVEPVVGTGVVEERLPIPFDELSWNTPDPNALLLNVERAVLDAAPRYQGESAIPDTAAAGWDAELQQYWAGQ